MIAFSEQESKLLNLNVFRAMEYVEESELEKIKYHILNSDVDICKLKINLNSLHLLENLRFPYSTYTYVQKNTFSLKDNISSPYDIRITCSPFTFEQKNILLELANEVTKYPTGVNYLNAFLSELYSPEMMKNLTRTYIQSIIESNPSKHKIWLFWKDSQPIGYFMGKISEKKFIGTLFGIAPDFRNNKYANDAYWLMFSVLKQEGFDLFENDIQIQNIPGIKAAMNAGMRKSGLYMHIIAYPMLKYSRIKNLEKIIINNGKSPLQKVSDFFNPKSIKMLQWFKSNSKTVNVNISRPINSNLGNWYFINGYDTNSAHSLCASFLSN